jgi:hypothetical protein
VAAIVRLTERNGIEHLGGDPPKPTLATHPIRVGGETIIGIPEADADRTSAEGKALSVQFVHFPFTVDQIAAFSSPNAEVVLGFTHASYGHMAIVSEAARAALTIDFG